MSKIYLFLLFFISSLLASEQVHAGFLFGLNALSLNSTKKTAKGWYRTPASNENVEIEYNESMFYLGTGLVFEAGLEPGFAGIRLTPTLYKSTTQVDSSNYTVHVYDLLGFNNDQSQRLAKSHPAKVIIRETGVGTGIVFKYNFPVAFKSNAAWLKTIQLILATSNPWFGMGPMQFTFRRVLEAADTQEFAAQTYTDFYFILGGGFNVELNKIAKVIPPNIIISTEFLFSMNLTADNNETTNDDNLNFTQSGFIFSLGFGYRI